MMFPSNALARHAKNGVIHRCFDHIVAADLGLVVAVPVTLISGCLKNVPAHCPVPWQEMWAILDTEASGRAVFDLDLFAHVPQVLADLGIAHDEFAVANLPEYSATVFAHKSGLRLGISNDFIEKVQQE